MEKSKITGIVLAGGKSSRMGTDKSLISLNGKPLIQHAIDIVKPLCDKIIISANNSSYDFTGYEIWADEYTIQAPIIGICSCLKRSSTNINLVISCDMPLVPTSLFTYMLSDTSKHDIIIPKCDNLLEPLCGIYKKNVLQIFEEAIKNSNYRLHEIIRNTSHLILEITPKLSFYKSNMFLNVNTMDDYRSINP